MIWTLGSRHSLNPPLYTQAAGLAQFYSVGE